MPDKRSVPAALYDRDYFLSKCGGYKEFSETRGQILPYRISCALDAAGIAPGMKVADIGCGRGELALHAAKKGAAVLAIDYSEDALKLASELISGASPGPAGSVSLLKGDINELQLPAGGFDIVFMTDIVEHLYPAELGMAFSKVLVSLKPGGKLVVHTAPNAWYCRYGWPVIRRIMLLKECLLGTRNPIPEVHPSMTGINERVHVNLQDPARLKQTLLRAGFAEAHVFFNEEGPLEGRSPWNKRLNRVLHSPVLEKFFNISIFAVARKAAA